MPIRPYSVAGILAALLPLASGSGGEIRVTITPEDRVQEIGVVRRFDAIGMPVREVDPKAKFHAPYRDQTATGGSAVFRNLPLGKYDVILFLDDGTRIEGYHWPIFDEFEDPALPGFRTPPPDEVAELVREKIAAGRYYENKIEPLAMGGDEEQVRVLVQLLRDERTSFDGMFGEPVATLRYEIWQYDNQFGGWVKERQTRLLHRLIDGKSRMRKRTWLWDPKLGGLELREPGDRVQLDYRLPAKPKEVPGLHPY